MPDLDLKSMSDNELLDRHSGCNFLYTVFRDEIVIRLSTLRAENERLKAELAKRPTEAEAVVMRELCEAFIAYEIAPSGASSWQESMDRLIASRDAYRAMKGGSDA